MKKVKFTILLVVLRVLFVVALPAGAVTDGELDVSGLHHAVLLVMDVNGEPTFRCSATMLTPTVVLTAGHCASNFPDSEYTGMRIFTESDVQNGDNNYPFLHGGDNNCVEAVSCAAHPT